ncbi:MAG: hypothetical protein WCH60_07285 [Burkholderiales bacterium]
MHTDVVESLAFAKGSFRPHGHIEIFGEGQMVTSYATGSFNLEGLHAMHQARIAFLQRMPLDNPWVVMVVCHNSVMMPPEGAVLQQQMLKETFSQCALLPRAYAWVASGEVEGFDFMAPTFKANFAAAGIPMRTFHDPVLAEQWLMAQLQNASQS